MRASMILAAAGVLLCATFSPVQLFKFGKSQQPAPPQQAPSQAVQAQPALLESDRLYQPLYLTPPRYYPLPADYLRQAQLDQAAPVKGLEVHASKTIAAPTPAVQAPLVAQPPAQSIAYLVVRPVARPCQGWECGYNQQQQPEVSKTNYLRAPEETKGGRQVDQFQQQQIEQLPLAQGFGEQRLYNNYHQQQSLARPAYLKSDAGAKGGRQSEEQADLAIQNIEQQHEQAIEQQQQVHQQPALVVPVAPGKEGKLRALLDKLMSKLTLGSSYQVVGEEIIIPSQQQQQQQAQPQLQSYQQQPIQQQQIEQQQQQQQVVEDQRLEQQLEQQRDNGFDENTKQIKSNQQLQQHEQLRDEQVQQSLTEQELTRQKQVAAFAKGQQEPLRQEPSRQQELELATKGKRQESATVQQQQLPLANQEPIRQESKGNY